MWPQAWPWPCLLVAVSWHQGTVLGVPTPMPSLQQAGHRLWGEEGRFRFRKVSQVNILAQPPANSLTLRRLPTPLWASVSTPSWSGSVLVVVVFCFVFCCFSLSTWYSLQSSQLSNCLDQTALWASLLVTVLIVCWCRRVQPSVGCIIPRLVALNSLRKLAEHKLAWEPRTIVVYGSCTSLDVNWIPWLEVLLCEIAGRPAGLEFLPWVPALTAH